MKQSLGLAMSLLALGFAAACAPGAAAPTPGAAPPRPGPDPAGAVARPAERRAVEADVRFVTQMIPHHAQALEMVRLVPSRSAREDVRLLAERIGVSQQDEISMMQRWLRDRGQPVPAGDAHHAHAEGGSHAAMRGMLSREEMQRLADATGEQFDRLFLESMIRHHEGALHMVAELFASPGGGQEVDVFSLASEIDSDQRMEIARMRRMLSAPRRP